ncbi:extracellular solute-binding protein [Candidatus Leptofilum sp.]|uniref:extracellular solute-binding protein n=1 Tax=Candidatus Leptofilum sp. TaxID=3241576 RepID=UPI003B5AA283
MSKKYVKWFMLLALIVPMFLVACGGTAEDAVEDAVDTVEDVASDVADTVEEAAEDVAEEAEEVMDEVEETAEEVMDEAEEVMDEAEEAMEEVMEPCGPVSDGPFAGVDPRGQTVVWWHNHSSSREELLLEIVAEYNETNECGITIEALNQGGYNDIRDAVNASVAAGEVPAALVVGYQNDQAFYQLNESLVDLNEYVNDSHWGLSEEEQASFYQSFFNQSIHVAFDDQRLGFPPNRSIELLHVNMSYLRDLGYDAPPTTPDEFVEMSCAAAAASESGVGGYVLRDDASALAAWTFAFGGDVLNAEGTEYIYNSDATVQAMEMLVELATLGEDGQVCAYFFDGFPNPEVASRNALFAQGSSSGIPFYVGDFATIAEDAGTEPDEYGVAAIPHITGDPVMNIYGGDVMIVKTTPEQQLAAWQFVKWFTSPEPQARWVEASNYFPTNAGAVEFLGDYNEQNPVWATALDLLQYGKFEPQLISYQSVRDAAQEAYNVIIQGGDVQATLDDLTETANELQEELLEEIGN